jgi:hypothetical protein
LTDGPRFAKNFEEAMRFMWQDWCEEKTGDGATGAQDQPKVISPPKRKKKSKKRK